MNMVIRSSFYRRTQINDSETQTAIKEEIPDIGTEKRRIMHEEYSSLVI